MRDGFEENFTLSIVRKKSHEQISLSPSNIEKYDVYFKRYI